MSNGQAEPGDPPAGAPGADAFIDAVLEGEDPLQLVVAGPGAGKTHLFEVVLTSRGGQNLAVTFINGLVRDLEKRLGGLASVNTFHGYAKQLLHHLDVEGLTHHFNYLPESADFLHEDAGWLMGTDLDAKTVEKAFHLMQDDAPVAANYLRAASYYDVVSHNDAVYRLVKHLDDHADDIPAKTQIVVDEIQDFNELEMSLIRHLATKSRILAAGDDDQALYAFKHATPQYIRELGSNQYTVYELPYCFRCPHVIIHAVHDVIAQAKKRKLLTGRMHKKYWVHPAKNADSQAHPKVRSVLCSVDKGSTPYPARYILKEVQAIPAADIAQAWEDGYPSVMVIGPKNFLNRVYATLHQHYKANVRWKEPQDPFDYLIEGYQLIAKDPHSRLGWRLVTLADPPPDLRTTVLTALNEDKELDGLLDQAYVTKHRSHVSTVRKMMNDEAVAEADVTALQEQAGLGDQDLPAALGLIPKPPSPEADKTLPEIVLTSFTSAKGLSADYVFVVGMLNGQFPQKPNAITDTEVCEYIVALTRTRKQCHLIASNRYADDWAEPSIFFSFIKQSRFEFVEIDKNSNLPT